MDSRWVEQPDQSLRSMKEIGSFSTHSHSSHLGIVPSYTGSLPSSATHVSGSSHLRKPGAHLDALGVISSSLL